MRTEQIIKFNEFEKIGRELKSSYCQNQSNEKTDDNFFGIILYENNIYTSVKNCKELLDVMKSIINTIKHDIFENRNSRI